jgi:cell division protein FtsW
MTFRRTHASEAAPAAREHKRTDVRPIARRSSKRWDVMMIAAVVTLVTVGIVVVYSSSSVFAARVHGDAEHFLKLQLGWLALGLVGLGVAMSLPGAWLRRRSGWTMLVAVVLCTSVLVPGVGHLAGGARRWLSLGWIGFQPSEFAKLAVIAALASILALRDRRPMAEQPSLLIPVLLAQIPVVLILIEPDLGNALVIELIVAVMVFVAGLRVRTIALASLAALPVFYTLLVTTPFRLQRLLAYIDPWAYRSTVGYQVTEALISIGAGGITGVGLGESKHKLFFLPAAHTDFIFAILSEELGLIGVTLVLLAVAVLAWRGVVAAGRAATSFDAYLAVGLTALILVPSLFNMGVATGMLPTKGLPLPLVSYGGSNLVTSLIGVGLLLRVARDGREARPGEDGA